MAIDWKTIISEFDGKPTLVQAIGKLRKAVEDETITFQQAQAEIAKLESQQKADEALITTAQSTADEAKINAYNASQKGDQALEKATTADTKAQAADTKAQAADTKAQAADTKAQAADTKAQQALENLNNKQDKITQTTNLSCRKIKTDSLSYTMELGSDSTEYDYGLLFASKNMVSTGQLKPSFADGQFFDWLLPPKSGTLATTNDIAPAKLYMHFISITTGDPDYDRGSCYTVFYSYNSTPVTSYLQLDQRIGEVGVDWYLPINGDVAKQVNGQWSIVGTTTLYKSNGIIKYFEQANPSKTGFVSLRDTIHEFDDEVYEVR